MKKDKALEGLKGALRTLEMYDAPFPTVRDAIEQAIAALESEPKPLMKGWVAESDLKLGSQLEQLSIWYSQKVLNRITHQSRHVIVLPADGEGEP